MKLIKKYSFIFIVFGAVKTAHLRLFVSGSDLRVQVPKSKQSHLLVRVYENTNIGCKNNRKALVSPGDAILGQ